MPYSQFRAKWRGPLRGSRIATYVAMAGLGACAMIWHPRVSVEQVGVPATVWWASLVLIGGVGCIMGTTSRRYRIEWISLGPAIGGTLGYAGTLWGLMITGGFTVGVTAAAVTTIGLLLVDRFLWLSAWRDSVRKNHDTAKIARAK